MSTGGKVRMATTDDARAGWELYRNSGFTLTRDEINDRLRTMGYAPISLRTHEHYRRLQRRGFRRYITINRLDTMGLPDPFEDESIRSRYGYREASVPTQLILHLPTQQVEILSRADSISDFGTEVVVDDATATAALRAAPPQHGTPTTVNFLNPPATTYGVIDFISTLDPDQVRIGVVFRSLVPVQQFIGAESLPTERLHVRLLETETSRSLDVVSKDVYWLLQAVEAARGLTNLLLDSINDKVVSPPPTVESLSVSSPMNALLKASVQIVMFIDRMAERLESLGDVAQGLVATYTQRPVVEGQADVLHAEAELVRAQAENIRAQTQSLRIDNARKELAVEVLAEGAAMLIESLRAQGKPVNEQPQINAERMVQLLFADLEPSVRELTTRGLEIEVAPEDDPDPETD
jgi:hypothetical protein